MAPSRAVLLSCLLVSSLGAAAPAVASTSPTPASRPHHKAASSAAATPERPAPVAVASARSGRSVVRRVNAFRRRHNRRPVRFSPTLSRTSKRHSHRMLKHDRFGHGSSLRAIRGFSPRGEVIAAHRGWRPGVGATVRRWARSPGHRSLLLHPSFRYAGGSPAYGRFGRKRYTTWTMHLGGK